MKSIKKLLSGIGCLLVAILAYLLADMANGLMTALCLLAFFIGCMFLIEGIFSKD